MKFKKSSTHFYAALGALLGLAAPVGALLFRLILTHPSVLLQRIQNEWEVSSYYYLYMTVGTITAFMFFGFFLGKKVDALENEKKNETLRANTDGLTGLYNHRFLQQRLSAEIQRANRYGESLSCLMMDIDNFKTLNDRFGHPFGDEVLQVIADQIREGVRGVDIPGRYGGEEFMVVMPHTRSEEAKHVAERIRQSIEALTFQPGGEVVQATISIGLATCGGSCPELLEKGSILAAADAALYAAKRAGKNRTITWTQEMNHPASSTSSSLHHPSEK